MTTPDTLICPGGELKALDDAGSFGGYLVLFGDAEHTDASQRRDFFTPETDFGLDLSTKSRVLYNHGLDPELGTRSLGIAELKADQVGIWMQAQLKARDEYEAKIQEMIRAGKQGLSSGTVAHLVRRSRQTNGAHKVLAWPLGLDASILPTPAEPRTTIREIKSLAEYKAEFLGPDHDASQSPHAGLRLASHLESVRAAVKGLSDRLASYAALRREEGRAISADRLAEIKSLHADLGALVRAAESVKGDDDQALYDQFLATSFQLNL